MWPPYPRCEIGGRRWASAVRPIRATMFGTASNLLVQAELARIDASVVYERPHRFLLGLLRDARLRRPADDVAIVLEPTGQQITQSFPEPVQSIVDRLLQQASWFFKVVRSK